MVEISFIVTAIIIAIAGTKLSKVSDRLADRTGAGEAMFGGILLGASTSIPGIVLSTVAAYQGHSDLAVSNAIGGIAAQTFFLCLADIFYRKSNLEHAAASRTNIMFTVFLIILLTTLLVPGNLSSFVVWGFHPISIFMIVMYVLGVKYVQAAKKDPMWFPKMTEETKTDVPKEGVSKNIETTKLWIKFFILAIILAVAGYSIERFGVLLAEKFNFSHYLLGSYFTAISTSLPELIVCLAAVRAGAITLAVSAIVGGNTFDVLFIAFSDIAYQEGSIYHTFSDQQKYLILLTILMNATLALGLIRREKFGLANIGVETWVIGTLYIFGLIALL